MGLESEPGADMGIGCGQWASIPADRMDDKIRRQMNLLLEVPEEQMAGWPRLTRLAGRRGANRKDLRLPRFHITYKHPVCRGRKTGACCALCVWGNRHSFRQWPQDVRRV